MSVFSRFPPRLQEAIVSRLGWSSLRPVQEQAGEALLDGCNAVILAPTAGGKTEASVFPTLAHLMTEQLGGVGALYVAPIKALLNNQRDRLGLYTEMVGMKRMVWHGDVSESERKKFLNEPTDFLMTTPESLEVMLMSTRVNERVLFKNLRVVIVDEVHAMAGTDRGAHLMSVIERLTEASKHDVQRIGLSATVGNPDEILRWLTGTSKRPGKVIDPPTAPAARDLLIVYNEDMAALAQDASKLSKNSKSLFFCQTRAMTENIAQKMKDAGTEIFVHHGSISKEERGMAEARFHSGDAACIICTSTLELGIDVGDLDRVFQANAPTTVSSFKQRMGRTGRREGRKANTTFFCDTEESVLQATALIELTREKWVESVTVHNRVWPVLIHQLLAMSLAKGGISRDQAWAHLSKVPDFSGIHRAEFERLVDWLIRDRALFETSGLLVLGPKSEHRFGKKNFMELFAVFSTPEFYTVAQATGPPLGFLEQEFVDMLSDGISSFLLAGKPWFVTEVRHTDKRVIVAPAPRGREPKWGGFSAQFLGYELCQKMKSILQSDADFKYLDELARLALRRQRDEMANIWEPEIGGIIYGDREIIWWTYAGGRINSTLRRALNAYKPDWEVAEGNYNVRIRGKDAEPHRFQEALTALREFEFWSNEKLWADVSESLPGYRLSKFQPLMPPWVEREVLATHFLDIAGTWVWLTGSPDARLLRVPISVREPSRGELTKLETPVVNVKTSLPESWSVGRKRSWIASKDDLDAAVASLKGEPTIALDVETTLGTQSLCLIQLASPKHTYFIDALEISDLSVLGDLLEKETPTKLIHNASFEREVLGRHGLQINGILDTMVASRERNPNAEGGHTLRAVCARDLNLMIDKTHQTSDWSQRPLSLEQLEYAATDVEVLLALADI